MKINIFLLIITYKNVNLGGSAFKIGLGFAF